MNSEKNQNEICVEIFALLGSFLQKLRETYRSYLQGSLQDETDRLHRNVGNY